MSNCRKCWSDASLEYADGNSVYDSQTEVYHLILERRDAAGKACTPQEQAGDYWDEELQQDSRAARRLARAAQTERTTP